MKRVAEMAALFKFGVTGKSRSAKIMQNQMVLRTDFALEA